MTYITYRVTAYRNGEMTDTYFPCGNHLNTLIQSLHQKGLEVDVECEVATA